LQQHDQLKIINLSTQIPPDIMSRSQDSYTTGSGMADTVAVEVLLTKINRLEKELDAVVSEQKALRKDSLSADTKGIEAKVNTKRCELLSALGDILVKDPNTSEKQDLANKMWNLCFYKHISDLRNRIAKQKSQMKKRQASGGDSRSPKKAISDLEKNYSDFLSQSVTFYEYIIKQLLRDLAPLSQTQSSDVELSQEDDDSYATASIKILYKAHLHLGDLHRYAAVHKRDTGAYKKADGCYLKAAKLSPGTGNPYNQLAVVAQSSQDSLTAVALYFYARSLMATNFPFETSRQNIVRLFESNRKWLGEHSRDGRDTHTRGIINVAGNSKSRSNKKEQKEWLTREQKATNRKALARLVDLVFDLFRGVSLEAGGDDKIGLNELITKMSGLIETFGNLTLNSAFGEGLLCKLVCVLAFTTLGAANEGKPCNIQGFDARRAKDPKFDEGVLMANQALAFSFFLRFTSMFTKHLQTVLEKKKKGNNNKISSTKSFSPLLLGLGFVNSIYAGSQWFHGLTFYPTRGSSSSNTVFRRLCEDAHVEFWTSIGAISNLFDALPRMEKGSLSRELGEVKDFALSKDFVEFRGFVPFASFLDKEGDPTDWSHRKKTPKFVCCEEALEALNSKPFGSKTADAIETAVKVGIFLSIAEKRTRQGFEEDSNGQYFLAMNAETKLREYLQITCKEDSEDDEDDRDETQLPPAHEEEAPAVENIDLDDDDEAGDTVVENLAGAFNTKKADEIDNVVNLKYSEHGLLTPAALLAASAQPPSMDVTIASSAGMQPPQPAAFPFLALGNLQPVAQPMPAQQPKPVEKAMPPPPGLMPPPGFAAAPSNMTNASSGFSLANLMQPPAQQMQHYLMGSQLNNGLLPPMAVAPNQPNMFPETLNPFAQLPPPTFRVSTSGVSNAPPGLMNTNQGSTLLTPGISIDSILGSFGGVARAPNNFVAPSALDLMMPTSATQDAANDPSDSLLNFLFEPSTNEESRGKTAYLPGFPPTKNPFAT